MSVDITLYAGDNDLVVDVSLVRLLTGDPHVGASVAITIMSLDGTPVTGVTWPLYLAESGTLDFVERGVTYTGARYLGTIENAADIEPNVSYLVHIRSFHPTLPGYDLEFIDERVAQNRRD